LETGNSDFLLVSSVTSVGLSLVRRWDWFQRQ